MADERLKVSTQAASVFADLLESLIVDVATEAHRAARLGLDCRLNVEEEEEVRLAAHARAIVGDSGNNGTENGSKHTLDVFGQTHPTIASEMFECMNCGRLIVAGRFAPHLEKCMGKGRKARLKANRNMNSSQQQRRARSSPKSAHAVVSSAVSIPANRTPNRTPIRTPEDTQKFGAYANDGSSEESHDEEKDLLYGPPRPGRARSKKGSGGVWKSSREVLAQSGASLLVPVALQLSPVRLAIVASVGNHADTGPSSSAVGMTVEVAIEQYDTHVAGKVPTSGDFVFNKPGQQRVGLNYLKGRKVGEKKKHIGQVLAGSSPATLESSGTGQYKAGDFSKENNCLTRVSNSEQSEPSRGSHSQNGVGSKPRFESSSDMYSNGDGQPQCEIRFEGKNSDSPINFVKKVTSRAVTGRGQQNLRPGLGVVARTQNESQVAGAREKDGREGITEFGKRKKRPRATSKPKQPQASGVAPASGITTK